jgi:hypothetical protein
MTPSPIEYEFTNVFDENRKISLLEYNIETIPAEKLETVLRRGDFNTCPKDFYDVYILSTTQNYNQAILHEALENTAKHRRSKNILLEHKAILKKIGQSENLKKQWEKYQSQYSYAKNISYDEIVLCFEKLLKGL